MLQDPEKNKYEIFLKNIDDKIKQTINENFSQKEIEKLNKPPFKYLHAIFLAFSCFLLFGGFFAFVFGEMISNLSNSFFTMIFIISALPMIPALVFFTIGWFKKKTINKLFDYFKNPQNLEPFYHLYSELFQSEIVVNKANYEQIDEAINYFPSVRIPSNKFINLYLQGLYQGYDFEIGTNTYRYLHSDNKGNEYYINEEHLYLKAKIDATDFQTRIMPETTFSRVFKKRSDRSNALESVEFEKIFKLEYDEPIKLRKLLSPRVMEKLTDLAKTQKVPEIIINDDQIIIHQIVETYIDSSYASLKFLPQQKAKKSFFGYLKDQKFTRISDLKMIIKQAIAQDFEKMNHYLKWVDTFKLHHEYEIKMFQKNKI